MFALLQNTFLSFIFPIKHGFSFRPRRSRRRFVLGLTPAEEDVLALLRAGNDLLIALREQVLRNPPHLLSLLFLASHSFRDLVLDVDDFIQS